jgi:hypothetical protein
MPGTGEGQSSWSRLRPVLAVKVMYLAGNPLDRCADEIGSVRPSVLEKEQRRQYRADGERVLHRLWHERPRSPGPPGTGHRTAERAWWRTRYRWQLSGTARTAQARTGTSLAAPLLGLARRGTTKRPQAPHARSGSRPAPSPRPVVSHALADTPSAHTIQFWSRTRTKPGSTASMPIGGFGAYKRCVCVPYGVV